MNRFTVKCEAPVTSEELIDALNDEEYAPMDTFTAIGADNIQVFNEDGKQIWPE